MSNVWAIYPSADIKRADECARKWLDAGYNVAMFLDHEPTRQPDCDRRFIEVMNIMTTGEAAGMHYAFVYDKYNGYWRACNELVKSMLVNFHDIDYVVAIGDDMDPSEEFTAQELAEQMHKHFGSEPGIMQPCGDPQGKDADGVPAARRICGSPWINRAWIDKVSFDGVGPFPEGFRQYYGDEFLKEYAEKNDMLWMRDDVTQLHRHWSWGYSKQTEYQSKNQSYWAEDEKEFKRLKELGFPGEVKA